MKLYPPIIEGKIPAQSGTELTIPFRFNRSVSPSQVLTMVLKIKSATTSSELKTLTSAAWGAADWGDYEAKFIVSDSDLKVGQYYKVQLACEGAEGVGYYSSVGVFKYTASPEIKILGFDEGNANQYEYVGYYYNEQDLTEKVSSYCFEIRRQSDNTLYASSGELLHDTSSDEITGESKDYYELETSLQEGESYKIVYKITTINGLGASSPEYEIVAADTLPNPFVGTLIAESRADSGAISLRFEGAQTVVGQGYGFVISRAEKEDGFSIWRDIIKFTVAKGSALPQALPNDYSVEAGKEYKYALQLYQTTGLRSTRLLSNSVIADFEDIFLYDGDRQLRVSFNPKVSSFKTNVLESKTDMLGAQYPFFFRNGNTNYKEFPIQGLLSYLMDEAQEFTSLLDLGIEQGSTDLTIENFRAEREFKLKVLEWLNNGKPKLFRSPAEGNYIVRLMNVSATPTDSLGRMLHSFSCTAYEIAECSYRNMVDYGFVQEQLYDEKVLYYCSEEITKNWSKSFAAQGGAIIAVLREVPSRALFQVKFTGSAVPQEIMVGATGTYNFNIYDKPIEWIALSASSPSFGGYLDYGVYETASVEDFSDVHNITYSMQPFDFSTNYSRNSENAKLIQHYNSLKLKVGYIYVLRLQAKQIEKVYQNGDKYYTSTSYLHEASLGGHDVLYQVDESSRYIDGYTGANITTLTPDYQVEIVFKDGTTSVVDLSGPNEIIYHSLDSIQEVKVGNGVLVDGMYQQAEYLYGIELTDLANLHEAYEEAKETGEGYEEALNALNAALAAAGIKEVR